MLKIEKEGKIELIPIEQPKPCQCTSQLSADKRTYPLANAKLSAETQNGNLPSFLYGSRMQESQRFGRLMQSAKEEPEHIILMTEEEFENYQKRLYAITERGFRIEFVR